MTKAINSLPPHIGGSVEKNLSMQETWVQSLGWEDPLEKEMTTHFSILAWKNPMDRGAWWAANPWDCKE